MLTVVVASAADLPWECPTFTEPADARPYFDAIVSVYDIYAQVDAEVDALTPSDCVMGKVYGSVTCTSGTLTITRTFGKDEESTEIVDAAGTEWTRLYVWSRSSSSASWLGDSYNYAYIAEWDGSFGDLPPDAWVDGGTGWSTEWVTNSETEGERACTSTCCMDWSGTVSGGDGTPVVTTRRVGDDQDVEVSWTDWGSACVGSTSTLDGVSFGPVDESWEVIAVDPDGDGYTDACDCDEADPDINAGEYDDEEDGVDENCDGVDGRLDSDGDGYDRPSSGGSDCDDSDHDVHPSADDPAGDGEDQDCDGADDVDDDGDGYTADGDDQVADCDDAHADAHEGGSEIGGDGVDQDCDGADDVDADGDGYTVDGDDDADCDDADPDAYPGAHEIPDDGIDQDCDGADQRGWHDRDGDGFDDDAWGGEDCDDLDPRVNPDAEDVECDGVDSNCDGEECPPPVAAGETEIVQKGCAAGPVGAPPWMLLVLLLMLRR